MQPCHLAGEEQSSVEVPPGAVVDIPGQQNCGDLLFQSENHEVFHGCTGGSAHLFDGGTLVSDQAAHGAVDVQVRCVEEFHGGHRSLGKQNLSGFHSRNRGATAFQENSEVDAGNLLLPGHSLTWEVALPDLLLLLR